MRVPNISTYANATYRLGNLTSDLETANEVMSTQKQMNEISDDPLGLSQVLSLKDTLGNLDQIKENVTMGKTWISSVENALASVNDLILEMKTDVMRLANDSTTADERKDAVERVDSIIQQIVTLGNTQVNGNYIFSGTDTDVLPFEYDAVSGQVIYHGNDNPFEIRTDKNLSVEVGRSGSTTFWDEEIHINSTNNTIAFKEDNGHGDASEKRLYAVIPEGMYTKDSLETAVRNALNDASDQDGYGLGYLVEYDSESQKYGIREDGAYTDYIRTEFMWETGFDAYVHEITASGTIEPEAIQIDVLNENALTIATKTGENGTEPLTLVWHQAEETWAVKNNPGYAMPFEFSGTATGVDIALNDIGVTDIRLKIDTPVQDGDAIKFEIMPAQFDTSAGHEIGFNTENVILQPPVSDIPVPDITPIVIDATHNKIDFLEVYPDGTGKNMGELTAVVEPDTYAGYSELAREVEKALEAESWKNGNSIDYSVSWDGYTRKFTIQESGSSLQEFHLKWQTGENAPLDQGGTGQSMGSILGFNGDADDVDKSIESSRPAQWGAFNTLIDLKSYLSNNDRDGIERTIGRLEINYDNMTSRIVDAGMKYNRLDVRETITTNVSLSLTERRSTLEDADAVKAIMDLQNIENAYQAALSSTATVLNISLVDYLT